MKSNSEKSNPERTCNRCGKAKSQGSGGSITQWISGCKCAELTELHELQQATPRICATCGKSIQAGRPGSLTQWVFRQDICACQVGGAGFAAQFGDTAAPSGNLDGELDTGGAAYDDEEISVDENWFPIARYSPLAELGKGAAGTVFLCRDRLLGQKVAVKCLNYLTADQLLSFQQEAKATSKLTHPNIVKVINFDVTDSGSPYMVLEYFPSVSLADLIAENGGLAWNKLAGIFHQVIDGLAYAHAHDIFHRDVKPSNILLQQGESAPKIRIIDFGVALVKSGNQEPTIHQGRTLVGTPEYMSPDQAVGIAYDARSEIYSLGCLIFEAATGAAPFEGQTPLELITHHAQSAPPLVSELAEHELPSNFDGLIASMLEKDPNDRPQSMEEVRNRLAAIEQPPTQPSRSESQPHAKRRLKSAALFGSVMVILLAFVAISYLVPHESKLDIANRKIRARQKAYDIGKSKFTTAEVESGSVIEEGWKPVSPKSFAEEDLQYLPDLARGKKIRLVNLSGTPITGTGLKFLSRTEFKDIDLSETHMLPEGYKNLAKMTSITKVDLNRSAVSDDDLASLAELPDLRYLYLSSCEGITDSGAAFFPNFPALLCLDLSGTKLTDEAMKQIVFCPLLDSLYLDETAVTDEGLRRLERLDLMKLRLNACRNLTSASMKIIAKNWTNISELEINSDSFSRESLRDLAPCKQLNRLNIVGTPVGDEELQVIGTFKELIALYITQGEFDDKSLKNLYNLQKLETISLMNCTNITEKGLADLKKHLKPSCAVICPNSSQQTLPATFTDLYRDDVSKYNRGKEGKEE